MPQNKELYLFLASSIEEFKNERRQVGDMCRKLNNILVPKGRFINLEKCEYADSLISRGRKQDEYNSMIRRSDIFVVIFGIKAGSYTLEEYRQAKAALAEKKDSPLILIYFKKQTPANAAGKEVVALLGELDKEKEKYMVYDDFDEVLRDLMGNITSLKGFEDVNF